MVHARQALLLAETNHPGNTPEVAMALSDLVGSYIHSGTVDATTLEVADREVAVAKEASGSGSKAYVNALGDKVEVLVRLNRAAEARPLAEQGLKIAQEKFPETIDLSVASGEVGMVCTNLGDFPCALRAYEMSVDLARRFDGPGKEQLRLALSQISTLHYRMGDTARSIAASEESLAIAYRVNPGDRNIPIIENNLGAHYTSVQKFDKALEHLSRALELSDKYNGPGNWLDLEIQPNLATVYARTGNFPAAWKAFETALSNRYDQTDRKAGIHALYAQSLAEGGSSKQSVEEGLVSARMSRDLFVLEARVLPERQALAYDAVRPRGLDTSISVALAHPELPVDDIYQEVIRSRALVADEMARRQKNLNADNDPETARLLKELAQARAELFGAESSKEARNPQADPIEAANARMETIERSLAERSAALRNEERIYQVTIENIRTHLPPHAVLISYVLYRRGAVDRIDPARVSLSSYAAFILHPETPHIHLLDLGDASSFDELVRKARAAADSEAHGGGLGSTRNERNYRQAAQAIRERVWDPPKKDIGDARLVLVVADGNLNLVPFAGLPDGAGYLVEHGPVIHTLSSERDLVPTLQAKKRAGLLAIGSPTYQEAENTQPPSPGRGQTPACEELSQIQFQALPGSGFEVADIDSTWRHWNKTEPSELLTGSDATLDRFLSASSDSRVLHLATHAFLLDKACGSGNPLLHSGLVFAAAGPGAAKSILTAQQIASLDLGGVDWAVLSACNTGNGELSDGEGVLGLQRAFRVAGARSVIMTLWPVDDDAARRFMHELYTERLGRQASTADAVWNSARAMLLERRAAGKSTHPWYWAGFVGSGGWE
jgi:CHAT domain-containing protein